MGENCGSSSSVSDSARMKLSAVTGTVSRCPLLVECHASASRGDSTDKRQRGVAVYRWNAALNRWTECHAVLLTPLWPTKLHFHAALPSQVAIFEHEAARSGDQRPAAAVESTDEQRQISTKKGSKNVGFHPLRAIFRVTSANSANKRHRDKSAK